jgi:hypothetical protein
MPTLSPFTSKARTRDLRWFKEELVAISMVQTHFSKMLGVSPHSSEQPVRQGPMSSISKPLEVPLRMAPLAVIFLWLSPLMDLK